VAHRAAGYGEVKRKGHFISYGQNISTYQLGRLEELTISCIDRDWQTAMLKRTLAQSKVYIGKGQEVLVLI
jgi:hypothetical protein